MPSPAVASDTECHFRDALAQTHQWGEVEEEVFRDAAGSLVGALACLRDAPITPVEAAAIHVSQARVAWLDTQAQVAGAPSRAIASLRGLALADATAPTPAPLDQDPHLLAVRSETVPCSLRLPAGAWSVNGVPSRCFPAEAASVVQSADDRAWYVYPGAIPRELRRRPSASLAVAGGASLVAGAAALWGAAETRQAFLDEPDARRAEELDTLNLGLGAGGYVLGAAGLVLGGSAVIIGGW